MRKAIRKHGWLLAGAVLLPAALAVAVNLWIVISARHHVYRDADRLPFNETGLLLGTSKYLSDGSESLDFRSRMDAAALLFRKGKIRRVLASGTGLAENYDEPAVMMRELMERGVPEEAITLDPAGFRTLDSVVRARRVFGLERITIISQEYHNPRALFIARHCGLDAVAFCAEEHPPGSERKSTVREFLARIKAMIDLLVGKEPEIAGGPAQ